MLVRRKDIMRLVGLFSLYSYQLRVCLLCVGYIILLALILPTFLLMESFSVSQSLRKDHQAHFEFISSSVSLQYHTFHDDPTTYDVGRITLLIIWTLRSINSVLSYLEQRAVKYDVSVIAKFSA